MPQNAYRLLDVPEESEVAPEEPAESSSYRLVDVDPTDVEGFERPESPGFWKSAYSGFANTLPAMAQGFLGLGGSALGIDSLRDWGFEGYKRNMEEGQEYAPSVELKHIDTAGEAFDFAREQAGALLPTMVEAAAGALIGSLIAPGPGTAAGGLAGRTILRKGIEKIVQKGMKTKLGKEMGEAALRKQVEKAALKKLGSQAGMFGTVTQMEAGGNYGELMSEHGVDAPWSSLGFGAAAASLEFLGGNIGLIDKWMPGVGKIMGEALKNGKGGVIRQVATEIIKNVPAEMVQEGGQELLSILNTVANTDEKLLTNEHGWQIASAAVAGGIGGVSGVGPHVIPNLMRKERVKRSVLDEKTSTDPLVRARAKEASAAAKDELVRGLVAEATGVPLEEVPIEEARHAGEGVSEEQGGQDYEQPGEGGGPAGVAAQRAQEEEVREDGSAAQADRLKARNQGYKWGRKKALRGDTKKSQQALEAEIEAALEENPDDPFFLGAQAASETLAMGGVEALQKQSKAPEDPRFMFAGPRAKTAERSPLTQARKMDSKKQDMESIRKKTGWFKAQDGKWRFEIDDSHMRVDEQNLRALDEMAEEDRGDGILLSDLIDHPKLFKAYPELEDVFVSYETAGSARGQFDPETNTIGLDPISRGDVGRARDVLAHEAQHIVQGIEDFAKGTSKAEERERLRGSLGRPETPLHAVLRDNTAAKRYMNSMGEIEARDTAARAGLTPEQRKAQPPYESQGIAKEDVIVRFSKKPKFLQQPGVKTLNDLYKQAKKAWPELKKLTQDLAKQFGGEVHFRPGKDPLKGRTRAQQKAENEKGGDYSRLTDVVGSTILFDTEAEVIKFFDGIVKDPRVVRAENRYAKPQKSGYRDIIINLTMSNGHIVELQANTKTMAWAKEEGISNDLYNVTRDIKGKLNSDKVAEELRPDAEKMVERLLALQRVYHQKALDTPYSEVNAIASSREISTELNSISAAIMGSEISTLLESSTRKKLSRLAPLTLTKTTSSLAKKVSVSMGASVDKGPVDSKVSPSEKFVKKKISDRPYSEKTIRSAFPGAQVEGTDTGWTVTLPNGVVATVNEGFITGVKGAWVDESRTMWLTNTADAETVFHEAFHAAWRMALTEDEKQALIKKHGSEGAAADAYGKWKVRRTANPIFEKIYAFFDAVRKAMFKNADHEAFLRVHSGEAFKRHAAQVGDVGIINFQLDKEKWQYPGDAEVFGSVNNRLHKELELFELFFGNSNLVKMLPGKQDEFGVRQPTRAILARDLGQEMFRVRDSGLLARMMNPKVSPASLAKERMAKGEIILGPDDVKVLKKNKGDREAAAQEKFINEIRFLREGKLYLEVDGTNQPILSTNGKAGMSADFMIALCQPTTPCKECYAAKAMIRLVHVRKAIRNTAHVIIDPIGWAKLVAAEARRVSKVKLPFIRLLGSGDLVTTEQVEAFNELARRADRPIQIFSRHHDNLGKLSGTQKAPFVKMGSIDSQLYEHYGFDYLAENMEKRGIANAWLLTDMSEMAEIQKLHAAHQLALVLAADWKLHEKLPKTIQDGSCPCDADKRSYMASCRQCALGQNGCFMAFSNKGFDTNGKVWNLMDPKAPKDTFPFTIFLEGVKEKAGASPVTQSLSDAAVEVIGKSITLINQKIIKFKAKKKAGKRAKAALSRLEKKKELKPQDLKRIIKLKAQIKSAENAKITLKDVRFPEDEIRVSTLEAAETYKANLKKAQAEARKGTFILPEGNYPSGDVEYRGKKRVKGAVRFSKQSKFKPIDTKSKAFRKWFGKSKVVDEDGEPLVVYHGTAAGEDFQEFDMNKLEFGAHFTPLSNVASGIAGRTPSSHWDNSGPKIFPAYLSIKNPVRLVDEGNWTANRILNQLQSNGIISESERGEIDKKIYSVPRDTFQHILGDGTIGAKRGAVTSESIVRDFLIEKGYDGVIYLNRREVVGVSEKAMPASRLFDVMNFDGKSDAEFIKKFPMAHDSFIAISPTQIKSAISNTGEFSDTNPDIRYSRKPTDLAKKRAPTSGHKTKVGSVKKAIAPILDLFEGSPQVVIVDKQTDLPEDIQAAMQEDDIVDGIYWNGMVILVAENLQTVDQAMTVFMHEAFGHYGLRGFLGDALNPVLDEVYRLRRDDINAFAEYMGYPTGQEKGLTKEEIREERRLATEEWVANEAQQVKTTPALRKVIQAIRRILRSAGVKLRMADADIQMLIADSRHFALAGGKAGAEGTRFHVDAWHGSASPHDKFDMEHMKTGEGVHAFGWGLYFTSIEEIARDYAERLGGTKFTFNGVPFEIDDAGRNFINKSTGNIVSNDVYDILHSIFANDFKKTNAIDDLKSRWRGRSGEVVKKGVEAIESSNIKPNRNLYRVTLHKGKKPGEYEWLDWNEDVGEERADRIIRQAAKEGKSEFVPEDITDRGFWEDMPGKDLYDELTSYFRTLEGETIGGGQKAASLFLLRAGIDGIRYPAGSLSGMKDTGAKNYVVFDAEAITIDEHVRFSKGPRSSDRADNVIPLVTRPMRKFSEKLRGEMSDLGRKIQEKVDAYSGWKFEVGDRVIGSVPGKAYIITGKTFSRGGPQYFYKTVSGDESGMFSISRGAHKTLKKMTGPRFSKRPKKFKQKDAQKAWDLVKKAANYRPEEGENPIKHRLLYHSGTSEIDEVRNGIEPRFGSWLEDVLAGATDEYIDGDKAFTPVSFYDNMPNWLRMQVGRKIDKNYDSVTREDIRKHGYLAVVYNVDEDWGEAVHDFYRVPEDGFDDGPHTILEDSYGSEVELYETNLYEEDYERSKTPFGLESGDFVTADAIEPDVLLTGDALMEFMDAMKRKNPDIRFSKRPWYSHMRKTIDAKLPGSGSGKQVAQTLKAWAGKGFIKPEEVEWSGIVDWLERTDFKKLNDEQVTQENIRNQKEFDPLGILQGKYKKESPRGNKVTKQQVLDWVDQNNLQVGEVMKGSREETNWHIAYADGPTLGMPYDSEAEALDAMYTEFPGREDLEVRIGVGENATGIRHDTKYSDHQLPGGKNYREMLITMPVPTRKERYEAKNFNGIWAVWNATDGVVHTKQPNEESAQKKADELNSAFWNKGRQDLSKAYTGGHWDEPNVLVHVRFDDRTGPNGEKILFIEEVQSDWQSDIRKQGVRREESGWAVFDENGNDLSYAMPRSPFKTKAEAERALISEQRIGYPAAKKYTIGRSKGDKRFKAGVVDAPWKKTYYLKAIQRMVRYAAEHGYDQLAWTPGSVQFERWGSELIKWKKTEKVGTKKIYQILFGNGDVYNTIGENKEEAEKIAERLRKEETWGKLREGFHVEAKEELSEGKGEEAGWLVQVKEQVGGTAGGMDIEAEADARGLTAKDSRLVKTKADLRKAIEVIANRERNNYASEQFEAMIDARTDKTWERMQKEDAGTSMPRKESFESIYDKKIRNDVNKFFNKPAWGKARVGTTKIEGGESVEFWDGTVVSGEENLLDFRESAAAHGDNEAVEMIDRALEGKAGTEVHSLPITDKMREKAIDEGMPLFSKRPLAKALKTHLGAKDRRLRLKTAALWQARRPGGTNWAIALGYIASKNPGIYRDLVALHEEVNDLLLGMDTSTAYDYVWAPSNIREAIEYADIYAGRGDPKNLEANKRARQHEAKGFEFERVVDSLDASQAVDTPRFSKQRPQDRWASDLVETALLLKERKRDWRKQPKDSRIFWDRILSLPTHYFKKTDKDGNIKIPALGRLLDAGLKWADDKVLVLDRLVKTPTGQSLLTPLADLKKKNKRAYEKLKDYLLQRDRDAQGYTVKLEERPGKGKGKSKPKKVYVLRNPAGKEVAVYNTENEAWSAAIAAEVKDYNGTKGETAALIAFRRMGHQSFALISRNMRNIIKEYEAKGHKLPKIAIKDDEGTVKVDLRMALSMMGDARGYYFPRSRQSGLYKVVATKEGENPRLEIFEFARGADRAAKNYRKQGYIPSKSMSGAMPEVVFELVGNITSQQQILNRALQQMDDAKIEFFGLNGYKNKDKFVVFGEMDSAMIEALETIPGMERKQRRVAEEDSYEIKYTQGIEKKIAKRLAEHKVFSPDMKLAFAGSFIEQVANIIKARGARARMIRRNPATGKDVWLGYEEDPLIAMTSAAKGLAGAEAKRTMAMNMTQAITGTDYTWSEYQEDILKTGDVPKYEDYMDVVQKRRISASLQPNAYADGMTYMQDMLRNDERVDRFIGTVKSLAVFKYLGFRVAAPLVNLTNMAAAVPAAMYGYGNIAGRKIPRLLGKASKDYFRYKLGKSMDSWTEKAYQAIHDNGWHESQFNKEATKALQGRFARGYSNLIEWSMYMFGKTEQLNRVVTIAAAYEGLRQQSKTWDQGQHEAALAKAKDISDKAHGIYHKANYPHWARGANVAAQAARSFYVFKTFTHNYMLTMIELGFNKKQRAAALWMAVSPAFIAGTGASVLTPIAAPLLGQLANAVAWALGKEYEPDDPEEDFYNAIEEHWGEEAANWFRLGVVGLGGRGVSVKGSLSINIGLGDLPTRTVDLLGAPGSVFKDVLYGLDDLRRGNILKGVEKISPLAVAGVAKGYREYTRGVTTRTDTPIYYEGKPLKVDFIEAMLRAASFNPARIAIKREILWRQGIVDRKYTKMREEINSAYKRHFALPARKQTRTRMQEIDEERDAYNARAVLAGRPEITDASKNALRTRVLKPREKEAKRK